MTGTAQARDVTGVAEHATPEQRQWFRSQKVPGTDKLCCNESDGEAAQEDIRGGSYWAQWGAMPWMPVPPEAVIYGPNKWGRPVVWWTYLNGKLMIKCFVPGGGL